MLRDERFRDNAKLTGTPWRSTSTSGLSKKRSKIDRHFLSRIERNCSVAAAFPFTAAGDSILSEKVDEVGDFTRSHACLVRGASKSVRFADGTHFGRLSKLRIKSSLGGDTIQASSRKNARSNFLKFTEPNNASSFVS